MATIESSTGPDPQSLLQKERQNPSFNVDKMNVWLEGGDEAKAATIKVLMQQLERDPIMAVSSRDYDYTKDQQREVTALKLNRLARYVESDGFEMFQRRLSVVSIFDPQVGTRIGINLGLFLNAIRGNGTAEQLKYWSLTKETAYIKGIYGCFGMTELAHGSNVAGVETTATFDLETDEFVVTTPHIGATKWWIGGAAHSATHAVVYARLIVKGKDYGVKTFVVPLRDANHDLMPGVVVGDIGAKMGRDGIDNGWIQFSSVRIPRAFMLQKFSSVDREGNVVEPPLAQLAFTALVSGRVSMVTDSFRTGARFITIALRYAVGRKQFKLKSSDASENQIINYPLHQRRLFPYLAMVYATSATSLKLDAELTRILNNLDKAVADSDMKLLAVSIQDMKRAFTDSAALKSTCTWMTADLIDQARQACGGHGYSAYSGFGKGYTDWVVQCTWEGDNNILASGAGRPLIQNLTDLIKKGKKVKGSLSFLNNYKEYINDKLAITKDDISIDKLIAGLEVLITRLAYSCHTTIAEGKGDIESIGVQKIQLAKLKAHHYLLSEFKVRVASADASLKPALQNLLELHAFTVVELFSGLFLTFKVLSPELFNYITYEKINQLCSAIRPDVVSLTDSFQYPDMVINSALGNYDGNIYENYFKIVKDQNPPSITKAPYSSELERSLGRSSLAERQRFEYSDETLKTLSK